MIFILTKINFWHTEDKFYLRERYFCSRERYFYLRERYFYSRERYFYFPIEDNRLSGEVSFACSSFGQWFNLSHSGRVIYGEKFWYSHHAFFHSIVASLLLAFAFSFLILPDEIRPAPNRFFFQERHGFFRNVYTFSSLQNYICNVRLFFTKS
jgi:hypothetical protein